MTVYVYRMNAGLVGTDESWVETQEIPYSAQDVILEEHASSYGIELGEHGQYEDENGNEVEPELWLEGTANSLEQLQQYLLELLTGGQTTEEFLQENNIAF